jgi:hypothetical protein
MYKFSGGTIVWVYSNFTDHDGYLIDMLFFQNGLSFLNDNENILCFPCFYGGKSGFNGKDFFNVRD